MLQTSPVRTAPIELEAALFDGQADVTSEATFAWRLSWTGTYHRYSTRIATGAAARVALSIGGSRLVVEARYRSSLHRASLPARITGINPSRSDVAAAIGADDVLKALCWAESTWRQFDRHGAPLKNTGSSARGIAQIMERFWARSTAIRHNDYARIAWQWDYCIDAAREILVYNTRFVRKKKPASTGTEQLGWLFATYHDGPSAVQYATTPTGMDYAAKILKYMDEKPWEDE